MLDRASVEALRNAWGGGDAVWLNPGIAAEFPLPDVPPNRWDVWQSLQGMGIDLALVQLPGGASGCSDRAASRGDARTGPACPPAKRSRTREVA